jgi:hypothetical protein
VICSLRRLGRREICDTVGCVLTCLMGGGVEGLKENVEVEGWGGEAFLVLTGGGR